MEYLDICRKISSCVKSELKNNLLGSGFVGDTCEDPNDLKSAHRVDRLAIEAIKGELKNYDCNIFIESAPETIKKGAKFSIFIDPIDGSLNWDRGVGDPCIAIAISEKINNIMFRDLIFAFVEGLRSGDFYYTDGEKSMFFNNITKKQCQIKVGDIKNLAEATAYLRFGYSLANRQLDKTESLLLSSKDIRSFENTGIEICEIARNAADFLVEARKESDFFNLLAYPILKNAGVIITDLDGNSYNDQLVDLSKKYDFVCCANKNILSDIIKNLS